MQCAVAIALKHILCWTFLARSLNRHERSHHQKKCSLLRDVLEGYKNSMANWAATLSLQGEHAHVSRNALVCTVCVYVKVSEVSIGMLFFRAHGATAARPWVLHFLQRPPLWWPVSAHCHPESTSVNMLKPLLLLNSSKPKGMSASYSAVKAESKCSGKELLRVFSTVSIADVPI